MDHCSVTAKGQKLRSEEHTSELQSQSNLVCRLLLEKKKKKTNRLHGTLENESKTESRLVKHYTADRSVLIISRAVCIRCNPVLKLLLVTQHVCDCT